MALYWGCFFGYLSAEIIWCITPLLRAMHIIAHPWRKIIALTLSIFLAPVMETFGLFFSRIHVTNSQGPPPAPIGAMDGDENQKRKK
jgi:hypothetical protein